MYTIPCTRYAAAVEAADADADNEEDVAVAVEVSVGFCRWRRRRGACLGGGQGGRGPISVLRVTMRYVPGMGRWGGV